MKLSEGEINTAANSVILSRLQAFSRTAKGPLLTLRSPNERREGIPTLWCPVGHMLITFLHEVNTPLPHEPSTHALSFQINIG